MKKQIVLYKKLSPALMARLQEQYEVTLINSLDADGLMQLRDALPRAHGLLGASLSSMRRCSISRHNSRPLPAYRWVSITTTSIT